MTRAQSQAMDLYWHIYSVEITKMTNIKELFPDKDQVILEIGSGMGEATAQIAKANPNTGYLAVEMHKPGLAALLLLIAENQLSNIKIVREDATYLLANFIPDFSLDGIQLGTLARPPVINRRKVWMTSSHHAPYILGLS